MLTKFKTIFKMFFVKIKPVASGIGFIILFLVLSIGSYALYDSFKNPTLDDSASVTDTNNKEDANCNVAGINLHGELKTYIPNHADNDTSFNYDTVSSENIIGSIKGANDDSKIKAIVVEVDSPGGSPVAGEEIANAIKNSNKPVVAFIRELGASSSYWAISSASKIFASVNSNVGDIGITSSYISDAGANAKKGYTYEQLSAGKYKDAGNADKPLTEEERALFMRDINIVYQNFIKAVAQNRNIPIDKVKSMADGATVLGLKGKELGLIDTIGGISEVEQYLDKTTGETPVICWQ